MKAVIKLLILLALAVFIGMSLRDSTGYINVIVADERWTVSLTVAVIAIIVAFFLAYIVVRFLSFLLNFPERFAQWKEKRSNRKDLDLFERGWVFWLEGRNEIAQKDLKKLGGRTKSTTRQIVALLAAAKAAHRAGDAHICKEHLDKAVQRSVNFPELYDACITVKSEILLNEGRGEEALVLLEELDKTNPNQNNILKLKLRAYKQTNRLRDVIRTARALVKKKQLDSLESRRLIERAAATIINSHDDTLWESLFNDLSSEEQKQPLVALAAYRRYMLRDEIKLATKVLESAIAYERDSRLIKVYGVDCPEDQVSARLAKVNKWLEKDYDNPDLLNTAAYLCMLQQLWGQAQRYLEQSLEIKRDSRTHALLGTLFDRLGQPEEALKHWRMGATVMSTVPNLVGNRSLPAADMAIDPDGPPDIKNLSGPDDRFFDSELETSDSPHATQVDEDEYIFDTAPISHLSQNDEPAEEIKSDDQEQDDQTQVEHDVPTNKEK